MFRYLFLTIFACFIFQQKSFAQQQVGLQFMDVWQSSKVNPAHINEEKLVIGLPGFHFNYYNTSGNFNELVVSYFNKEKAITPGEALNNLSPTGNVLRGILDVETLNIGYRVGKLQLGFSHAQKNDLYLSFPQTLAKLFLEGNGQYVGQEISLDHDFLLNAYNEFALSAAMKFGKISVGARAKYLTGIGNATVGNQKISLFTDDDVYQLTLKSDYDLSVSSLATSDDLDDFNLGLGSFSFNDLLTKNSGMAFDLGLTFQATEKLQFSASILDVGKINWSENTKNYSSQGTTTYDGFDFSQFADNDSISFNSAIDTLESTFNFQERAGDYSTSLPTKIYLSGRYQLNEKLEVGAMYYYENYRGENFSVFGLSGNMELGKIFSVGATYSARQDSFFNLGLNFVARYKFIQLFATTDNVVAAFQPYKSSNVNFQTGLNLLF